MIERLRRSDIIRHGSLVFVAIMAANAFTYLYYALVSRAVGVEAYGEVSALFSAVLLIATAPGTVAATVIARLSADLYANGSMEKLRRLGIVVSVVSAAVGAMSFLIVALLASPIAEYFRLPSTVPVLAAGAFLALSFTLPAQRGIFQGAQSFGAFAVSNVVEAVSKCLFGVVLAVQFGSTGAICGLAIGAFAGTAYNVYVLLSVYANRSARLLLNLQRIITTSTGIGASIIALNALLFYDVILVRHYFPPVLAGLYGASALVGRAVYTVISFVPTIVLPKASARSSAGSRTLPLLAAALGTGALIVGVSLVAVLLAPRLIVSVLAGKQFAAAAPFVLPYTIALGGLALANIVAMYNIGLRNFAFVAPLSIVALGEISAVVAWHANLGEVLAILVTGHAASFVASLTSLVLNGREKAIPIKEIKPEAG